MKFSGFVPESFQDYDKGLSSVLFVPSCNYKCPTCHAKKILQQEIIYDEEDILENLKKRKKYINKVVISGGEPNSQPDLIPFLRKLKQEDFDVKLDTNGSDGSKLQQILEENLANYVAMDVKGPFYLYGKLIGKDNYSNIEESMKILSNSNTDYEFRTTVVPIESNGAISWLKVIDYENMAKWIVEATGNNQHKHYLQKFVARSKEEMVDERFSKENLPREMHETPNKLMQEIQEAIIKYLPNCKIR